MIMIIMMMEREGDSDTNCNWCTWKISKGLVRGLAKLEIGGRIESIQVTALRRSARILRRALETGDLLSFRR